MKKIHVAVMVNAILIITFFATLGRFEGQVGLYVATLLSFVVSIIIWLDNIFKWYDSLKD